MDSENFTILGVCACFLAFFIAVFIADYEGSKIKIAAKTEMVQAGQSPEAVACLFKD